MTQLRCMVVDDSLVFRKVLRDCLAEVSDVEVVAVAGDGVAALEKIRQHKPDFITLDLDMPVMDGLMVLERIRDEAIDVEVLVVSGLTADGAEASVRALSMGALDVLLKPSDPDMRKCVEQLSIQLHDRIAVITTRRSRRGTARPSATPTNCCSAAVWKSVAPPRTTAASGVLLGSVAGAASSSATAPTHWASHSIAKASADVIVIGISTGGPAALQKLLPALPASLAVPVVIVQHMPKTFTASLARDLNAKSAINVKEAAHGDLLLPGIVYIAPAGSQSKIVRKRGASFIEVNDDPPIRSCKPSVDYLFRSAASEFGNRALGVIMTGMGNDGTDGAALIRAAGGQIVAQDEASCTIYGMPKAAIESGAVNQVSSLEEISGVILRASGTVLSHAEMVKA
ncbi:MAG TPA: chemotaxis response regulator protein-glutamate methylesterase [Planctomycetaceae bacterium]|nr:chemotaxis response regulator protein-glutamate methylesterase [Planctomycetaceae bacterium]